jgi:hypothetical protein
VSICAKTSDGPHVCPTRGSELRADVYVDERVDFVCERCEGVVAIKVPGHPGPQLELYVPPRA